METSMDTLNLFLTATAIVVLGSTALGIGAYKRMYATKSLVIGYFWGNRALKVSDITQLLLSSSFSLNGTLYQTWLGYQIGPAALWLQLIWCLSYVILSWKAENIRNLSSGGTLHGVIGGVNP